MPIRHNPDRQIRHPAARACTWRLQRFWNEPQLAGSECKCRSVITRTILRGTDDRLLVVVGPCSIHDPVAALDYMNR